MIFVIAAVFTLIVSFVVALASLIRERNKQMGSSAKSQPEAKGQDVPLQVTQTRLRVDSTDEPLIKPIQKSPEEATVDATIGEHFAREPFFWEKMGEQMKGENVDRGESIEKVQQRLVEHTLQQQKKDIAKDDKIFLKKEIVKNNLSGEFSLSDLK